MHRKDTAQNSEKQELSLNHVREGIIKSGQRCSERG